MVIVTTSVYMILVELDLQFNLMHWAGLTDYTKPYGFAISYVFDKQLKKIGFIDSKFSNLTSSKHVLSRSYHIILPNSLRMIVSRP